VIVFATIIRAPAESLTSAHIVPVARPRKFREKLEGWLVLVRTMWPQCPASIDRHGSGLFVDRANAVLPNGEADAQH
jgi:hypothetical protein